MRTMEAEVVLTQSLPIGVTIMVGDRTIRAGEKAEIRTLMPPEQEFNGLRFRPHAPEFYSLVVNDEVLLTTRKFHLEEHEDAGIYRARFPIDACVYVSRTLGIVTCFICGGDSKWTCICHNGGGRPCNMVCNEK